MPNYFYIDASGTRQGPITDTQLKTLATQGVIRPETPLETESGYKGVAGQISGLNFNNMANAAPKQQGTGTHDTFARKADVLAKKAKVGGILSWLLDFGLHDIRLPIINLWACRIIYAICWVVAVLALIFGVFITFIAFSVAISGRGGGESVVLGIIYMFFTLIGVPIFIISVRLFCEWYIIIFDWVVETTKAARIYNESNQSR